MEKSELIALKIKLRSLVNKTPKKKPFHLFLSQTTGTSGVVSYSFPSHSNSENSRPHVYVGVVVRPKKLARSQFTNWNRDGDDK